MDPRALQSMGTLWLQQSCHCAAAAVEEEGTGIFSSLVPATLGHHWAFLQLKPETLAAPRPVNPPSLRSRDLTAGICVVHSAEVLHSEGL